MAAGTRTSPWLIASLPCPDSEQERRRLFECIPRGCRHFRRAVKCVWCARNAERKCHRVSGASSYDADRSPGFKVTGALQFVIGIRLCHQVDLDGLGVAPYPVHHCGKIVGEGSYRDAHQGRR